MSEKIRVELDNAIGAGFDSINQSATQTGEVLGGMSGKVDSAADSVESMSDKAEGAESKISSLRKEIATLQGKLDELSGSLKKSKGHLEGIGDEATKAGEASEQFTTASVIGWANFALKLAAVKIAIEATKAGVKAMTDEGSPEFVKLTKNTDELNSSIAEAAKALKEELCRVRERRDRPGSGQRRRRWHQGLFDSFDEGSN